MLPKAENVWPKNEHPTPKTEEGFQALYENVRKEVIDRAIKRYFDGAKTAKSRRYFWNDGKQLISEKVYRNSLALQKSELERTLSNLLRKDDKIVIPPPDS